MALPYIVHICHKTHNDAKHVETESDAYNGERTSHIEKKTDKCIMKMY